MATPNMPPDPPPSMSAAELRRRLLASTPPPLATALPDAGDPVADASWGGGQELLSRLRMPGKSGPVPAPAVRPLPPADPDPLPDPPTVFRSSVGRRTPTTPAKMPAYDFSAIGGVMGGHDEAPPPPAAPPSDRDQRYKAENKELRALLGEMKQLLQEASDTEARYVEQIKQLEEQLAEKDRQVNELSEQMQMIEDQIAKGELAPPPPAPKTRGELEEWADDLEREGAKLTQERKRMDEERRQLREDEEALEKQMRDMEVSMARERALLARQETELKRLNAEIQHELELMQRGDASLREQMAKFQRRAQEVLTKPPGGGGMRR